MITSALNQILRSGHSQKLAKCSTLINSTRYMESLAAQVRWQDAVKDLDPKQVDFYHKEQLIMVDEKDSVIGHISKGESHAIETVRKGLYHRALSLLIFDTKDRFLLTQRAECKITFPSYFTNACCSHPLYNELELEDDGHAIGVKRAVVRRSIFELGIKPQDLKIEELNFLNKLAYRAESDGGIWGEAEIDYIFVVRKDLALKPNREEVQSYRYVTRPEMQDLLSDKSDSRVKITPWVRLLTKDILFKYWDNLDNLSAIAQPDVIINHHELLRAE